jgi:hypothetical protein
VPEGRAAEVTTEVARITAKGGERGSDGAKEQRVDDPGIFVLS